MSQTTVALETAPPSIRRLVVGRLMLVAGLLATIGFGLVFPFPWEGRLSGELFDLAHAPVFCMALIGLIGFLDPPAAGLPDRLPVILKMTFWRVAALTALLMSVGLVGEYLQKFSGRSPSWSDVAANSAGLLAGLFWVASRAVHGIARHLLAGMVALLLVSVSLNSVANVRECIRQTQSFPLLASFERPRELGAWVARRASFTQSTAWSSDGQSSLLVQLKPGQVSGVAMVWLPRDWSNLKTLRMELHNPDDQPLTVFIKLFDYQHTQNGYDHHDRFHVEVTVAAGETHAVAIDLNDVRSAPADRDMDMQQIWAIEIFAWNLSTAHSFHVDDLRLLE
ncbi:MAG: hypothetical protein R3C59_00670 [Planctomycetaceae bacterium]